MNAKIIVTLAMALGVFGLNYQVQAQSLLTQSTLSGDSLFDIDNRNAENDFTNFFFGDKSNSDDDMQIIGENSNSNLDEERARLRKIEESLSQINTPIILQPAESFNGNDGVEFQVDLAQ